MSTVTVVTAFFDIGREEYKNFERSAERYFDYFRFWARIRNPLVIYIDERFAGQAEKIRAEFGRADATHIIPVPDAAAFDPEMLTRIARVMESPVLRSFRTARDNPECVFPLYNYIMYLKPFLVADAIERGLTGGGDSVAWLDFGYNHGGEYYTHPEEFDFLWQFDPAGKMHLFLVKDLDDTPVFEIVRNMEAYISGAVMAGSAGRWLELRGAFRAAMTSLTGSGLADDDQTLELMAWRENPGSFELHRVRHFFEGLRLIGGEHLTHTPIVRYVYKRLHAEARAARRKGDYAEWLRLSGGYLAAKITRRKGEG